MATFLVPGLELEDVLEACKTTTGRDLYYDVVGAVRALTEHVRRDVDDADAGAPAADPPSAAGAPIVDRRPWTDGAVSRSTPAASIPLLEVRRGISAEAVERVNAQRRAVWDYLTARPGQWVAPRDVRADLDLSVGQARGVLNVLLEAELVEHNGLLRNAARYRKPLPTDEDLEDRRALEADAEAEDVDLDAGYIGFGRESTPGPATAPNLTFPVVDTLEPTGAGATFDAAEHPLDPIPPSPTPSSPASAPSSNGHAITPRVRRELEREAQEQRDRAAARAAARELADGGTLEGRVTVALGRRLARGATLPELANELRLTDGDELRDLAAVLRRLEDAGDTERRGRRNGHVIYTARSPALA